MTSYIDVILITVTESSNIKSLEWVRKDSELFVTFQNDRKYVLSEFGVLDLADAIVMAERYQSWGKAYNNLLKHYNPQEVVGE
jgi:hypothetical protein